MAKIMTTFLLLSFFSISVLSSSARATEVGESFWGQWACDSVDTVERITEAAKISAEAATDIFRLAITLNKCFGAPVHMEFVLQEMMYSFVDYENDVMEVWRFKLDEGETDFYFWFLSEKKES